RPLVPGPGLAPASEPSGGRLLRYRHLLPVSRRDRPLVPGPGLAPAAEPSGRRRLRYRHLLPEDDLAAADDEDRRRLHPSRVAAVLATLAEDEHRRSAI